MSNEYQIMHLPSGTLCGKAGRRACIVNDCRTASH